MDLSQLVERVTNMQKEMERLRQALAEERDARKVAETALWDAIVKLEGDRQEVPTEAARPQG